MARWIIHHPHEHCNASESRVAEVLKDLDDRTVGGRVRQPGRPADERVSGGPAHAEEGRLRDLGDQGPVHPRDVASRKMPTYQGISRPLLVL